ncbi:MAG: protein translocase subunit SecF, partial [Candidatus Micrarchaeota archaeon]|nr:protein translocase subunit SecF [Candidatus Micrarchaeota archaeon]
DTDMMLTTRVVKRKEGTPAGRAFDAMKTAFLMNATTVVAFGVLTGLSIVLQIPTYYQIGAVATIGGIIDFVATWAGNAPLILHFTEGKSA